MLLILIDLLIITIFIVARRHNPEVGSGQHIKSVDKPTEAPVSSPQQEPLWGWAVLVPQPRTVSTSPQHGMRGLVRPGELNSSEIPVWTALDDHQLIRLLKQASS